MMRANSKLCLYVCTVILVISIGFVPKAGALSYYIDGYIEDTIKGIGFQGEQKTPGVAIGDRFTGLIDYVKPYVHEEGFWWYAWSLKIWVGDYYYNIGQSHTNPDAWIPHETQGNVSGSDKLVFAGYSNSPYNISNDEALSSETTGEWDVQIVDNDNRMLDSFEYPEFLYDFDTGHFNIKVDWANNSYTALQGSFKNVAEPKYFSIVFIALIGVLLFGKVKHAMDA